MTIISSVSWNKIDYWFIKAQVFILKKSQGHSIWSLEECSDPSWENPGCDCWHPEIHSIQICFSILFSKGIFNRLIVYCKLMFINFWIICMMMNDIEITDRSLIEPFKVDCTKWTPSTSKSSQELKCYFKLW